MAIDFTKICKKYKGLWIPLSHPSSFFGSSILKPIISIKISFSGRELEYAALLDSGADFCIFDAEIGEYLGIDIKNGFSKENIEINPRK